MTGGFTQRLDRVARNLLPVTICVVLVILSVVPVYLPGYGEVAANLVLMAVFYWSVHRPELVSPASVFGVGLLQDVLSGMAPGMNALVLVLVRATVVTQGRVFRGKSFLVLWWGFSVVAFGATFALWALTMGYAVQLLDPTPALIRGALTVALFPFLAWVFGRVQNTVLQ